MYLEKNHFGNSTRVIFIIKLIERVDQIRICSTICQKFAHSFILLHQDLEREREIVTKIV